MRIITLLSLVSVVLALPPTRPTTCIEGCTCKDILLNILNVVGCDGPLTINSTLFSHLDRRIITVISFSNVIISEIKEDAFKRLPNLEDVIIQKAQIGSIDPKTFNNVKKVKFADCGFEDSPNLSSEKLEELHYGNCKLDTIPALDTLFSLNFLNLSGNYIKEIEITSFAELFDLETLILSNNEISKIPANIFVNNEELSSLYLDNNPLKTFYFNTSNKLETLSIKNCFLSTFDERSTRRLTSLSELNLNNNRIKNLSVKDLEFLSQLTIIDLSQNSLKKLDNDIFAGNPKLQKVTLDDNKFESLPNFTLLHDEKFQIYSFSCKNCGLKTIHPNTFKNMPTVISLNLAKNNFTSIQNMFRYITSLRMLDVSYNNIETLAEAFDNNKNLESLNVAGNSLMTLNPQNFANNKAIKKIDASNCRLYKLWSNNATILSSVRKLFVADNHLVTLSISDFKVVPELHAVDLHGNPLVFNEDLCHVINYLESLFVYPIEYSKTNAEGPLHDDIDNFTSSGWSEFHNNKCPEMSNNIDDHESLEVGDLEDEKDILTSLQKLDDSKDDEDEYDDDDYYDSYSDGVPDSYADASSKVTEDENDDEDDKIIAAEVIDGGNLNLARVSYILSITSVFVLTALAVLIMAVIITLCILRSNNNFNRANLPRLRIPAEFKIPLWNTQQSEKKHSGSVYRPLSEDLSGAQTPKMSRYEFAVTPTVHGSNP
ncbi:unnamed protein product [Ceutorhynchus assimilis]|uniref:Uncharacterized protein n=1 Tax=Ceutorhynchus assimilis TaxID=467358 RepID=A0A9N9MHK0_9CUCU|nr:unnamed protein product [Ceutorhynchus assimilis]